jgi:hypothetical protein
MWKEGRREKGVEVEVMSTLMENWHRSVRVWNARIGDD